MPTTINFAQRSVGIFFNASTAFKKPENEGISFKVCKKKKNARLVRMRIELLMLYETIFCLLEVLHGLMFTCSVQQNGQKNYEAVISLAKKRCTGPLGEIHVTSLYNVTTLCKQQQNFVRVSSADVSFFLLIDSFTAFMLPAKREVTVNQVTLTD